MNNYVKTILKKLINYVKDLSTEKDFYKAHAIPKELLTEINQLNNEIKYLLEDINPNQPY